MELVMDLRSLTSPWTGRGRSPAALAGGGLSCRCAAGHLARGLLALDGPHAGPDLGIGCFLEQHPVISTDVREEEEKMSTCTVKKIVPWW